MSDLIERLQGIAGTSDHERGCAGREYSCSCGFDDLVEELCDKAQSTLRTQSATITTLQAELAEARDELKRLIESIWKAEYRREAPEWKPLPDLIGMITQMDNMYAGVRDQRDQARAQLARIQKPGNQRMDRIRIDDPEYATAIEARNWSKP